MSVKKYFIGIVLPPIVMEQVEEIKRELEKRFGLRGALRSPAHITLHRPFEWKEEKEADLIKSLSQFSAGGAFKIELSGFAFFEPRVIFVNVRPNENLDDLYQHLRRFAKQQLQLFNEWEDERGFHPHVTIANRDLKKTGFYALKPEFEKRTFEAKFNADSLALLKLDEKWRVHTNLPFEHRN